MYVAFCALVSVAVAFILLFFLAGKTGAWHRIGMHRYAVLLILVVSFACNSTPQTKEVQGSLKVHVLLTPPPTLPIGEAERLKALCERWYDSILKSRGFVGGIVVAKKGNIVFEAYNGGGQPGDIDHITDSTAFHIASVSKTFTAMAVLKLWQDGKLNIDDEFNKYFPEFNYRGVTIRTMLDHRSGLPNYVHFMDNMGWDRSINITNKDVLEFMVARYGQIQNVGIPDRAFTYCNTNYALLALLIEKISGKNYGDYLKETFFAPLEMNHSFVYSPADSGKAMLSYDNRGREIPLTFLDMVYGDKNIYSTPRDLLIWDRALTSGILFNEKTLAEAYAPYSNEKPGIRNYGLGWRMNIYPSGKKMIYHNGWWHGNNAVFIRLLEDSATIIVLGNKYNKGIYHAKDLANLFGDYFNDGLEDESVASKPPKKIRRQGKQSSRHAKNVARKKAPGKSTSKKSATKKTKTKKH